MGPRPSLPSDHRKRKHGDDGDENNATETIHSLEKQLTEAVASKSSLNPLADLLDIAYNSSNAHLLSKAVWALYRVFVVIIKDGAFFHAAGSEEARVVRSWLQEKLNAYVNLLVSLLQDEEAVRASHYLAYVAVRPWP